MARKPRIQFEVAFYHIIVTRRSTFCLDSESWSSTRCLPMKGCEETASGLVPFSGRRQSGFQPSAQAGKPLSLSLTQIVQLTAGICAAKALVQHLCKRFHNPENVHIFIPGVSIRYRHKFCVQEVLMHVCLPSFHPNALLGLIIKNIAALLSSAIHTEHLPAMWYNAD
jgi:hypothetical protein